MKIARGGWPWILGSLILPCVLAWPSCVMGWHALSAVLTGLAVIGCGFMVFFFRDPERIPPADPAVIVSGADGVVRAVEELPEHNYLKTDTIRVSVFLSPFNVHVNRAPMAGNITDLAYTPGKHLLTIQNASSEYNEHSSILIEGEQTRCLVKQIVGPVVRRVVYWLEMGQVLRKGDRIGIMKFGSRMDVYFPRSDVTVTVKKGDKLLAGITEVARVNKDLMT